VIGDSRAPTLDDPAKTGRSLAALEAAGPFEVEVLPSVSSILNDSFATRARQPACHRHFSTE
jgi:hypothetical protein